MSSLNIILIGRNNSGKSAILDALSLLPIPDSNNSFDEIPLMRGNKLGFIRDAYYRPDSLLYGYIGEAKLSYIFMNHEITFKVKPHNLPPEIHLQGLKIEITDRKVRPNYLTQLQIPLKESGSFVLYIPNEINIFDEIGTRITQEKMKNRIIKEKIHVKIMRELVNDYVGDEFTEFLFTPELELRKEFSDRTSTYINLKDMGSGVQKVSILGLWIELVNPKVILIDDIEATIHPSMLKGLMSWLKNKDVQVIMATHSIDVLNILSEIGDENTRLIQIEKSKDDIVKHNIISNEELVDLFDANVDPRSLKELLKI